MKHYHQNKQTQKEEYLLFLLHRVDKLKHRVGGKKGEMRSANVQQIFYTNVLDASGHFYVQIFFNQLAVTRVVIVPL